MVQTAVAAEAALQRVNIDPPDLVLLDIGLPGMDGLDTARCTNHAHIVHVQPYNLVPV